MVDGQLRVALLLVEVEADYSVNSTRRLFDIEEKLERGRKKKRHRTKRRTKREAVSQNQTDDNSLIVHLLSLHEIEP